MTEQRKIDYMDRAMAFAPDDTLLRTFACIACIDYEPGLANIHAAKMLNFYDGMSPLSSTFFNVALARLRTENKFDEATSFLKHSHWLLPYFEPTLNLLNSPDGAAVRSKIRDGGRRATMRIVSDETRWKFQAMVEHRQRLESDMRFLQAEMGKVKAEMANAELQAQNALLAEKKRLGIPDTWVYEADKGRFIHPDKLEGEKKKEGNDDGGEQKG